jgi:hypothetical protein
MRIHHLQGRTLVRKPGIRWMNHFEMPVGGAIVMFDFGSGPKIGKFENNQFVCKPHNIRIDRILVNRWRYPEADERRVRAVA